MRLIPFLITFVITIALIYALNRKWGAAPAFGSFFSPQHGFWLNAEPADHDFTREIELPGAKDNIEIILDERLVPHIIASSDEDAYYAQGYLHAKFRLFQMDIQTKAAEGRASEIAGSKAIHFDIEQRRLGMRFAAENALKEIEKDPQSKLVFDAYTRGVNDYIDRMSRSELPIEYKLLGLKPEKWSNIRTALLLKMMAKMLSSGTESDMQNTRANRRYADTELKQIYPQVPDSLLPIIAKGIPFAPATVNPVAPQTLDSLYFGRKDSVEFTEVSKPDANNGSNNWVVGPSKTIDGNPILANDPHLELSLPSIWFEQQITTPTSNCYGVSLPGSPFVIIGFNDSIAWGVTNAQRDVKDYYKIRFKDDFHKEYWFNGAWQPVQQRIEEIKVKDGTTIYDTVSYTVFGPSIREIKNANTTDTLPHPPSLAVRWVAHDPSNEGMTFYKLNRAKNYTEYADAIKSFDCPGQNFVFASRSGDIAIWQQGKFPARWDRQGLYVMPGEDSSYMWQGFIPQQENPHVLNPPDGFIQSANQRPADSTYPYFIPGSYITARGISIYNHLRNMSQITPQQMMALQNDYFNALAEDMRPLMLKYVNEQDLDGDAKKYLDELKRWDLYASPESIGQTVYQCWFDSLEMAIWKDELFRNNIAFKWPDEQTTMELIAKDSALKYADDINTPQRESLSDIITIAFKRSVEELKRKEAEGKIQWWKFKNPTVYHLFKEDLLPFARTGLKVGGYGNIINAITHSHGPSWRMVVHLTEKPTAFGVYPGGQSGNPGSKYYDMFVDNWAAGKYYDLWFMSRGEQPGDKGKWKITLKPAKVS